MSHGGPSNYYSTLFAHQNILTIYCLFSEEENWVWLAGCSLCFGDRSSRNTEELVVTPPPMEVEHFCIGTWNVRSKNQGKLEVVKQEMARVNVYILGIGEIKWTGMGEFNSDDHYICYCGQESLRRNGVAIIVNKWVRNAVLGCNLKNDRMISVHFQGKPFNITVIQGHAPNSNTEEAKVEWFYEDLQNLLELTPKKDVLFIIGD